MVRQIRGLVAVGEGAHAQDGDVTLGGELLGILEGGVGSVGQLFAEVRVDRRELPPEGEGHLEGVDACLKRGVLEELGIHL